MTELDPHLHTRINRFCEIGDTLAAEGKYNDAVAAYQYAWNLPPKKTGKRQHGYRPPLAMPISSAAITPLR